MIAKTKLRRIEVLVDLLKDSVGKKKSLGTWLFEINNKLPRQNAFKSTRELAQAFRYIITTLKYKINKETGQLVSNNLFVYNRYYWYEGDHDERIEVEV